MTNLSAQWKRYKRHNDLQAREQIILAYAHLAKYVVDRMPIRPSAVTSYDDLVSHAVVGLIDAVEKYDPSRDVKFESYAITRIRGSVLDALKSLDWVPRSLRSTEQELKRAFAGLEARLGRAATDEEVADELGVSVDELHERLSDVGQSALLSFEEVMIYGEENSGLAGLCSNPNPDGDPLLSAELGERTKLLATAISQASGQGEAGDQPVLQTTVSRSRRLRRFSGYGIESLPTALEGCSQASRKARAARGSAPVRRLIRPGVRKRSLRSFRFPIQSGSSADSASALQ